MAAIAKILALPKLIELGREGCAIQIFDKGPYRLKPFNYLCICRHYTEQKFPLMLRHETTFVTANIVLHTFSMAVSRHQQCTIRTESLAQ